MMKAAYLTDLRKVEIRDVPEPTSPGPGEVLLDVLVVGVCGSDMHYYRTGRIGDQVVEYPFTVGHEFAGRVREVGPGVTDLAAGQLVTVDPLMWCGQCDQCLAGREHTCRNHKFLGCPGQTDGCLCERLVMPATCCFPVPADISPDLAALIEPFTIGIYTARWGGEIEDEPVAILGAGPIGLCTQAACAAAGAGPVYMTDIREERVEFARRFGADWAGNPHRQDIVADILREHPEGLAVVFDATGEQDALDQAVELLAPGGTLVIVGIPEADRITFDPSKIRRKELTIQNVRRQNRAVEEAIDLVATGEVSIESMITHRYRLDQTQEAFDTVADYRDGAIKAMIHLD
jgi:L-iditol 2-dehydrogenase